MHIKQQQMAILLQLDQSGPQKRRLLQIERANKVSNADFFFFFPSLGIFHCKRHFLTHSLHRFAVHNIEARSQRLVPTY
ncbi:hypothetical protein C1I60_07290 [Paenibacillus terrae]|uniref:Uncharacterized protein n=1 Tax=Paenibacillus terrae TaxID=159743 RepID=A0A4U2Q6J9_9BACL|nr:hypothetical protein C1I60_07290 [Paenibacillus terrae]